MSHAEAKAIAALGRPEPYLRCVLPMRIVAKARPRFVRGRARTAPAHRLYLEQATRLLRAVWRGRPPLDEPLLLVTVDYFHRPKRLQRVKDRGTGYLPHSVTPDEDNAAGLPMDALKGAGVVADDSRISDLISFSRYLALDERGCHVGPERTEIELYPWFDWLDGRPWAG